MTTIDRYVLSVKSAILVAPSVVLIALATFLSLSDPIQLMATAPALLAAVIGVQIVITWPCSESKTGLMTSGPASLA
ncbi:MAG: hypothetical protein AAF513_18460 [Pseudomonadota bacterium]